MEESNAREVFASMQRNTQLPELTEDEAADHFSNILRQNSVIDRPDETETVSLQGEGQENESAASQLTSDEIETSEEENEPDDFVPPRNAENASIPFNKEETVFEDNSVKIQVKRISHRQEKKFRLHDMLLDLKITNKSNTKAPLLISILLSLRIAITNMLKRLQAYFSRDSHHQVYITVLQEQLLRGLQTGNMDLHTPAEDMAKLVINRIYHVLKSKVTMRADESFKVVLKILSVQHTEKRKKKGFVPHIYDKNPTTTLRCPPYIFPTPNGYLGQENVWSNMCLIISLLIGYFFCLFLEGIDFVTYPSLSMISKKSQPKLQQEGAATIHLALAWLREKLPQLSFQGPHGSEVFPILTNCMDCQIHIFSNVTGQLVYSYPENFNEKKRQIYLMGEALDLPTGHLHVIRNLLAFSNKFGFYCFYCHKHTLSPNYQHFCSAKKNRICFLCKRVKQEKDTYVTRINKHLYCNSKIHNKSLKKHLQKCEKCNLTFKTSQCKNHHKKSVCSRVFHCLQCKKTLFTSSKMNQEFLRKNHKCSMKICRWCWSEVKIGDNHLCQMSQIGYQRNHDAIGVLVIESISHTKINCFECFKEEKNTICKLTKKDFPNLCTLLLERINQNERGIFDRFFFSDNKLQLPQKSSFKKNDILCDVRPPSLIKIMDEREERKVPRRKTMMCNNYLKVFRKKKSLNALEKMLCSLLNVARSTFQGMTIILHCGQSFEMHHILQSLLSNHIRPSIFKKDQKLLSIELQGTKLRFIDGSNFFNNSVDDLRSRLRLEPFFFPMKLNTVEMYEKVIVPPPDISNYFNFFDSKETVERKEEFVRMCLENQKNWIFKEEIMKYCYKKCKAILIACQDYLAKSYNLQNTLFEELNFKYAEKPDQSKELNFYHNFTKPLVTQASFCFCLFRLIMMKAFKKINVVRNSETGHHPHLSKVENEWTSYVASTLDCPPNQIFSAFSNPKGQLCIKNAFPDIVGPGFTGWFHGCFYHQHSPTDCLQSRGQSKNDPLKSKQKNDIFLRKLSDIQNARPDLKVHFVTWECQWELQKKEDEAVKKFMTTYKPLPRFRLIPRLAGMFN